MTFVVATTLAGMQTAGSCVDGVTPDCSSAASQCAPSTSPESGSDAAPSETGAADAARGDATDGG